MKNRLTRDYMTQRGAEALCKKILDYWKDKGFHGIRVHLERELVKLPGDSHDNALYFVRSNIGPTGFPPLFASAKAA